MKAADGRKKSLTTPLLKPPRRDQMITAPFQLRNGRFVPVSIGIITQQGALQFFPKALLFVRMDQVPVMRDQFPLVVD